MLNNYGKLNMPNWVWWLGIIESRIDLAKSGRYQVRIMGYHTHDKEILPTSKLPYASVLIVLQMQAHQVLWKILIYCQAQQ